MRTKASRHSHILVPDGLTARLMRTTRIRPWPIGTVWSPANLFPTGTEEGLFLDLSDISTLYTDQTFATNISAIGDPVGGVLDKSKGLEYTAPLNENEAIWFYDRNPAADGWTVDADGKGFQNNGNGEGGADNLELRNGITAGSIVRVRFTVNSGRVTLRNFTAIVGQYTAGVYDIRFAAISTNINFMAESFASDVSGVIIDKLLGNHLIQATAAARPIWTRHPKTGVRNLLNNSEDLTGTGWGDASVGTTTVTDLGGVGPSGTVAHNLSGNNANTWWCGPNIPKVSGVTYTASAWVRSALTSYTPYILIQNPGGSQTTSTAIAITSEWQLVSVSITTTDSIGTLRFGINSVTGNLDIAACQLEEAATATAYQTRVSKYNVTEAGVDDCYGLTFDGVDDYMVTAANLDLSGTDKTTATSGFIKPDTTIRCIYEHGVNHASDMPGFGLFTMADGIGFRHNGAALNPAGFGAVAPFVATMFVDQALIGDVGGELSGRANGADFGFGVNSSDSLGNLGDKLFYVGARNGLANRFTGTIYGLTLTDYILDAEQLAALEEWTAARTPEVTLA